nr:MAG TPA: hypothetical protein [Caudoviricetes sp.]
MCVQAYNISMIFASENILLSEVKPYGFLCKT